MLRRAFAIAIAATLVSSRALAAPTPEDLETARELVKQGREARARGDLKGALDKFRAAHAAGQTPVTGIELARTYAAVGQLVEAREVALSIGRMPVATDETSKSAEARDEAARLAEELRPRIPSIIVRVEGATAGASFAVAVDGETLPPALVGEPRKVNPGNHTATLSSGGTVVASQSIDVAERETKTITLLFPSVNVHVPVPVPVPVLRKRGAEPAAEPIPDNLVLGVAFALMPHLFLPAQENPDGYKPIFGVMAGLTVEAGGAVASDFDVMLRALVTLGDRGKPSYIAGAGPAFSFAATRWLWLGGSLLAGRGETKFNGLPYSTDWVLCASGEIALALFQRNHGQWLLSFQPGYYFVNERQDNPLFVFPVTFGYRSF